MRPETSRGLQGPFCSSVRLVGRQVHAVVALGELAVPDLQEIRPPAVPVQVSDGPADDVAACCGQSFRGTRALRHLSTRELFQLPLEAAPHLGNGRSTGGTAKVHVEKKLANGSIRRTN